VTVTLTNGQGGATDWLAFAATGSANTSYVQFTYVGNGVSTRTWTVSVPAAVGSTYEFRLFANNGYTRLATSPTMTVAPVPPVTLTVDTTSLAPGTLVTATLANGFGGANDFLTLAATGSINTVYVRKLLLAAG
jgi:hypothetical protein